MQIGARLGPYEVLAPLGAGGMGEVWRARDPRLGRDVAIKLIHPRLEANAEQLRRFEQEARAVAALNHPNIVALFDIGRHEEAPFVITELLEGESLRERLGAPLPPRKAVEYAVQVAHGLAAAHEKGIVHRDLKPENLFVTKDSRVKILDFGIAKLTQPALPSVSQTEALTAAPDTEPGIVMGTVGYMSPEQVQGKPLDAGSDLFSLGVILYEMLSGKRPFQKQTAVETMHAILKEEPPELSETNTAVSPGLEQIVRHCLEKEATNRFQSARDVAFALGSLSQSTTGGAASPRGVKGRRKALSTAAAILLAGALLASGAYVHSRLVYPVKPRIKRLTFQRGEITAARFLPDGQSVVYAAAWSDEPLQLYSVRLDSPESRLIGFRDADLRAVSRGSDLALGLDAGKRFWITGSGPGTLAVAPFSGGAPRAVAEHVLTADFSPDGRRMAAVVGADRLEYPLGTVLRDVGPAFWIERLRVSPSGDRVAFVEHPRQTTEGTVTIIAPGGKTTTFTRHFADMGGIAWSPGGDEVWFSGADVGSRSELWAVNTSGRERRVFAGLGSVLLHDIGRDGRVLASTLDKAQRIFFGSADHFADRELSWFDHSQIWGLSHDGRVLLFSEDGEGVGSSNTLFVRDTDGSPPVKIGPHPHGEGVSLSPDGRFVVVSRLHPPAIDVIPVGAGTTRTISLSGFAEVPLRRAGLMADGKTVWFQGSRPREGCRIWITDLAGATPHPDSPEIWQTVAGFSPVSITPDERSFVARIPSDRGAGTGGAVEGIRALIPRSGAEPRIIAGLSGEDTIAGIAQDGRSLFVYRYRSGSPVTIRRVDVETGRSELLQEISLRDRAGVVRFDLWVTPDGQHFAYGTAQRLGDLYMIEGLR